MIEHTSTAVPLSPPANRRTRRVGAVAALLMLGALASAPARAFPERPWLHVQVLDQGDDTRISVNVPLGAVEALTESMGDRILEDALALGDEDRGEGLRELELEDIRALWQALRAEPGAWIRVDGEDGGNLRARMDGDEVRIEGTGEDGSLSIRLPAAVGDALFGGPEGTFDFAGAVRSLADHEGNVVSVTNEDAQVRIWIGPQ